MTSNSEQLSGQIGQARLQARVAGRKAAAPVVALALETAAELHARDQDGEAALAYWEEIRDHCVGQLPPGYQGDRGVAMPGAAPVVRPMTTQELAAFEAATTPFGKHKGLKVGDTPLTWLDWLAGTIPEDRAAGKTISDFKLKAERYLLDPTVREELEREREEERAEYEANKNRRGR